jgi:hypothetical protein
MRDTSDRYVTPAKAGASGGLETPQTHEIPAFAGMTVA